MTATVSVLFTDMVGSTRLLARYGAEAADELRHTHDAAVRPVIAAHGGAEVKSTGDGFMVVFGSAAAAVAAAIDLQRAIRRCRDRDGRVPELRIGLATGEAVSENGDWFGPSVIEAARLCADAGASQILATQVVALLLQLRGGSAFVPLGQRLLKGFDVPVDVVEIPWVSDAPATVDLPLPAIVAAHHGPLAGRAAELDALRTMWKEAAAGQRCVAVVSGEPGIGKTCLVASLAAEVAEAGSIVLWGRCDEELVVAHQPVVEALRHVLTTLPADALAQLAPRGELLRLVPELGRLLPGLVDPGGADPEAARLQLFEAVDEMIVRGAALAPLLIVVDDLHWADRPTLLLLRHLVATPTPAAVMIVATYRDTELDRSHPLAAMLADLRRSPHVERVSLRGLGLDAVDDLVERTVGSPPDGTRGGPSLAEQVHAETEGNPFFVVQVLHHLSESGRPFTEIGIPEGIREVIGHRLSRLPDATNRVLAVAAVVGPVFQIDVVEQVLDDLDVLDALDAAIAARMVEEVDGSTGSFAFVHALVRQTLVTDMSRARQARLHRRVGEILATIPSTPPARLAHHFCAGATAGAADQAVHWSIVALEAAREEFAWERSIELGERALEVIELDDLPDLAVRSSLRCELGASYQMASDTARAKHLCLLAAEDARAVGSLDLLVNAARGRTGWGMGGIPDPDGLALLREALDATPDDDIVHRSLLLSMLAFYLFVYESRGLDAQPLANNALALARSSGDPMALDTALSSMMFLMQAGPAVDDQLALVDEIADLADRRTGTNVAGLRELVHRGRVCALLQRGDRAGFDRTRQAFADDTGMRGWAGDAFVAMWAGAAALLDGDLDLAEANSAALLAAGGHDPNFLNSWVAQQVMIRAEQGRIDEVLPFLEQALVATPGLVALRALLADALAGSGRLDEARAHYADLVTDRLARIPHDIVRSGALSLLATVCATVGGPDGADDLHQALLPYEGQLIVIAWGVVCHGAADRHLAMLDTVLGRFDDADRRFAAAIALEERASAPALAAHTRLWWGRSLVDRDPASADRLVSECASAAERLGLIALARKAAESRRTASA